uniref:CNH domain-containing protein n=1 Tax=Timema bartmani TaxID=61472 RepID=A0A7R9I3C5_9NEOP|nr:unnamed protein product [Timema bartmani]
MSVKAFECVPIVETLQFTEDNVQRKIECLECSGKYLFIGTIDGSILTYLLGDEQQTNGIMAGIAQQIIYKQLEIKKPVKIIKAASALECLLVLSDTNLLILSMPNLKASGKGPILRGVTTFCFNEYAVTNDPFSVQICVGLKRQLQVYNVSIDKITRLKDIGMPDHALKLAANGDNVCVALQDEYIVYNIKTSGVQKLFSFNSDMFVPMICRITKEEFLVSANEGLGIFTDEKGMSNRPPVQWSYPLLDLAYSHPYILGLSDEVVMVYSILDQQQKQAISFVGGRNVGNFDGRIYINSCSAVYSLVAVPWYEQVKVLLLDGKVEEALKLSRNFEPVGMNKEESTKLLQDIYRRAGFIYFSYGDFDKAHELFENGHVDVREIISLFPGFLPSSSNFVRAVPPLHEIADVIQLFASDEIKIKGAKRFLQQFLEYIRESGLTPHLMEVDTALIKLFAEKNMPELETFITTSEITCDVKDCYSWLEKYSCYHASALLHRHAQEHDKALELWTKIIKGEYKDDSFRGLTFFIECLANLQDHELVWRYAEFVLSQNEELGVGIFTLRSDEDQKSQFKPDDIVDFLQNFPKAVIIYLEYLVLDKKCHVEKFHTHLGILYVENIIKLKKLGQSEELYKMRQRLQNLLQLSNLYRAQMLLGKMHDAELHKETAIVYGKLEEHDKALDILVHQLKDFKAAEKYCVDNAEGKDVKYKHKLFYTLLSVYLSQKLQFNEKEEYIIQAIELLNSKPSEFDADKVMNILPPTWSMSVILLFLQGALRNSLHKYRMSRIECALARGENLQKRFTLYDIQRLRVQLHETK